MINNVAIKCCHHITHTWSGCQYNIIIIIELYNKHAEA